jgi:hypothetical protein
MYKQFRPCNIYDNYSDFKQALSKWLDGLGGKLEKFSNKSLSARTGSSVNALSLLVDECKSILKQSNPSKRVLYMSLSTLDKMLKNSITSNNELHELNRYRLSDFLIYLESTLNPKRKEKKSTSDWFSIFPKKPKPNGSLGGYGALEKKHIWDSPSLGPQNPYRRV